MDVSPCDKMLCTFLTFDLYVVVGDILSEFNSQFLSGFFYRFFESYTVIGFQKNSVLKTNVHMYLFLCIL